jgi:hypothetical protein
MGRGVGKKEGGGGKLSFTLINREGQKRFNLEKGEGSKKFLNLNTISRGLISIITNSIDSQIIMPKR